MKLLGLTGGVGMGKSTALQLFSGLGLAVADTDAIARQVVEPGQPALAEIAARFGAGVLAADQRLDRAALARLVFADPAERQALEAILHPRIRARWLDLAQTWRSEGQRAGVVAIPLLFETGVAASFDSVLCVACLPGTQSERLASRGWNEQQIRERIQAQWPTEKKMGLSQFVLWTEGTIDALAAQVRRVLHTLQITCG